MAQANAADRKRRISDSIQTYNGQGIHRTATIVDNASADWLRQLAAAAGGDAHLNAFSLRQVDIRAAYIEVDGRRLEGVPLFDGGFTGDTGIVGTLGSADSTADIALVSIDSAGVGTEGRGLDAVRRERVASRNRGGDDHRDARPDAFERGLLCQSVRCAGVTARLRTSDSVDGARRIRRTNRVQLSPRAAIRAKR